MANAHVGASKETIEQCLTAIIADTAISHYIKNLLSARCDFTPNCTKVAFLPADISIEDCKSIFDDCGTIVQKHLPEHLKKSELYNAIQSIQTKAFFCALEQLEQQATAGETISMEEYNAINNQFLALSKQGAFYYIKTGASDIDIETRLKYLEIYWQVHKLELNTIPGNTSLQGLYGNIEHSFKAAQDITVTNEKLVEVCNTLNQLEKQAQDTPDAPIDVGTLKDNFIAICIAIHQLGHDVKSSLRMNNQLTLAEHINSLELLKSSFVTQKLRLQFIQQKLRLKYTLHNFEVTQNNGQLNDEQLQLKDIADQYLKLQKLTAWYDAARNQEEERQLKLDTAVVPLILEDNQQLQDLREQALELLNANPDAVINATLTTTDIKSLLNAGKELVDVLKLSGSEASLAIAKQVETIFYEVNKEFPNIEKTIEKITQSDPPPSFETCINYLRGLLHLESIIRSKTLTQLPIKGLFAIHIAQEIDSVKKLLIQIAPSSGQDITLFSDELMKDLEQDLAYFNAAHKKGTLARAKPYLKASYDESWRFFNALPEEVRKNIDTDKLNANFLMISYSLEYYPKYLIELLRREMIIASKTPKDSVLSHLTTSKTDLACILTGKRTLETQEALYNGIKECYKDISNQINVIKQYIDAINDKNLSLTPEYVTLLRARVAEIVSAKLLLDQCAEILSAQLLLDQLSIRDNLADLQKDFNDKLLRINEQIQRIERIKPEGEFRVPQNSLRVTL